VSEDKEESKVLIKEEIKQDNISVERSVKALEVVK